MSNVGRFLGRFGMVIRYLGMLGCIGVIPLLVGFRSVPMGFGRLVVMCGCFVVVVFGHGFF